MTELWQENISPNTNFNLEQNSENIVINSNHFKTEENFSFKIPTVKDIEAPCGTCRNSKLNRISLTVFPWSGKKIRAIYDVGELPDSKKDNKFASKEKTKTKVLVLYDIESNQIENICLLLDQAKFWNKYSECEIPIIENI